MAKKGWLGRKQVSPSQYFTFQVQGNELPFKIEMSSKNRNNRVFLYHNKIDYLKMKDFILANAFLVEDDPQLLNKKKLFAAKVDTTLFNILCNQMYNLKDLK